MNQWITWDRKHLWHPFTPIDSWLDPSYSPILIENGEGAHLIDQNGKKYLDGNSSIWTNLHGHAHPELTEAINEQAAKISHSSFLGLTHPLAAQLAKELIQLTQQKDPNNLSRTFFSDDGSTAIETAIKIVYQYFQQNEEPQRTKFFSLSSAYHGDTVGAMSLGQSPTFHHSYQNLLFKTEEIRAPYCYRCPYNRSKPEKKDARLTCKCKMECVKLAEQKLTQSTKENAAWVVEPRVQGAAGFIMHPEGYLTKTCKIAQETGAKVILDEVMTGFGRTGPLFAFQKEDVKPDLMALAKGLTGGYLPLAATLCTEKIFDGFRGDLSRTFYHGHSYTGNQLGCAAAVKNIELLQRTESQAHREKLTNQLAQQSQSFWQHPHVGDIRQEGLVLAIELVEDFATRKPFPTQKRLGYHICEKAKDYGLLTRPVGDVLMLMPPYCTTTSQLNEMLEALQNALMDILPA
ncbi:MAG: adenosylmethionine--8-amino-7-oxononanoate transaminase [Verrucomicrobiota bacterium]